MFRVALSWRQRRWMHRARRSWRTDCIHWRRLWFRNNQWLKHSVRRRVHLAFSWSELRLLAWSLTV